MAGIFICGLCFIMFSIRLSREGGNLIVNLLNFYNYAFQYNIQCLISQWYFGF